MLRNYKGCILKVMVEDCNANTRDSEMCYIACDQTLSERSQVKHAQPEIVLINHIQALLFSKYALSGT